MTSWIAADLPDGWEIVRLGDRFDSWGGLTPSKANLGYWGDGLPWVSSREIKGDRVLATTYSVTQKALDETGLRVCPVGAVLVVTRSGILAHSLPVAIADVPVTINQDVKAFYSDEPFLNEWLALYLRSSASTLLQTSRREGTTVQSVQYPILKDTLIPIPPVVQRQEIIEAAVRALGMQATVTPHVLSARRAIERFRQAVLAAACSGRLTADWRADNDAGESASDLTTRIERSRKAGLGRQSRASVRPGPHVELPGRWAWTTVGALVDVATGATPLRTRPDYYGGSVPWVTSGAVNAGVITEATEFITERALEETNAKVFPAGTLLVAMYGEGQTRGRVAELGISAATNQAVAALLFDQANDPLRGYIRIFFQENYERIRQLSFGGVQPNLSLGVIRNTPLPLPPHLEQREIVRRVSKLFDLADVLTAHIDTARRRLDRASQAILAKAFRGELLPNEAEVA